MFLTVHSTIGVFIGQHLSTPVGISYPIWAFFIGLASHYLLDLIPHGDKDIRIKKIGLGKYIKIALADNLLIIINIILIILVKSDLVITFSLLMAIIGSILPDWLTGIYILAQESFLPVQEFIIKILQPLNRFHHFFHDHIIPLDVSLTQGLVIQFLFLGFFWWLI